MKNILLLSVFSFCFLSTIKGQSPISTVVNQHHLGAWAYRQHLEILGIIEKLVSSRKIDLYNDEGKKYSYEAIRKNYLKYVKANDKENYRYWVNDTNYHFLMSSFDYPWFTDVIYFSDEYYQFNLGDNGWVKALRKDVDPFISHEQMNYLMLFSFDEEINRDSIPVRSEVIYNSIKKAIYEDCFNPALVIYNSQSCNEDDTCQRSEKGFGGFRRVVFIRSDPEDPTLGRDSSYHVPIPYDTSIVKRYIDVVFKIQDNSIKIIALGSYMVAKPNISDNYLDKHTIGYIRMEDIKSLSQLELKVLNSMLLLKIEDRTSTCYYDYNSIIHSYRNNFRLLKPEEGD